MNQTVGNINNSNVSHVNTVMEVKTQSTKVSLLPCVAIVLSFLSIIISVVALCSLSNSYDDDNAIVTAFGIITALLIGLIGILIAWQIWNTIDAKEKIETIDEKIAEEFGKYDHTIKSYVKTLEALFADNTNDTVVAIDDYFYAVSEALKSEDKEPLYFSLDRLENLADRFKENRIFIASNKKEEYKKLAAEIPAKKISAKLMTMLDNAIERQ